RPGLVPAARPRPGSELPALPGRRIRCWRAVPLAVPRYAAPPGPPLLGARRAALPGRLARVHSPARPRLRPRSRRQVHIRDALWRPGGAGVTGGLVLAGIGAIHSLRIRLELLPPSGRQLRFALRLRAWFAVRLGVPSS